jgi:SAM-dependent methyltransferase
MTFRNPSSPAASASRAPTHLDLARLAPRRLLSSATDDLYRHIARLVELGPDSEFLVASCGRGLAAQLLVETTGAAGAGVDPDPALIELASARAREAHLTGRLHYEAAPLDDLPYQDAVFDVAIGEIGVGAAGDMAAAVRELARVTRPMGTVVLIQFTWTGGVDPERREAVAAALGVRPHLLVECKQLLREAGVVDLYVEDWTDVGSGRHPGPLGVLVEGGSLRDRATILWRAWRGWGWEGVRLALRSGSDLRGLVTRERILGLSVIKGTKWRGESGA